MKQSEKLLTGKVPITTEDDFEQAWLHIWRKTSSILEQRIDSDAVTAEVVVCGNTHVICKKLASLRDSGFRRTPGAILPDGASPQGGSGSPSDTKWLGNTRSKSDYDIRVKGQSQHDMDHDNDSTTLSKTMMGSSSSSKQSQLKHRKKEGRDPYASPEPVKQGMVLQPL